MTSARYPLGFFCTLLSQLIDSNAYSLVILLRESRATCALPFLFHYFGNIFRLLVPSAPDTPAYYESSQFLTPELRRAATKNHTGSAEPLTQTVERVLERGRVYKHSLAVC